MSTGDSSILRGYIPTSDNTDPTIDADGLEFEYADPKDAYEDTDAILSLMQDLAYVAGLIIDQSWLPEGKKNTHHFEGFFTHERVNDERKTQGDYMTDDISDIIFPAMSLEMLIYLLIGPFSHMRDLVLSQVREGIILSQLVHNVGKCFGMKSEKYSHGKYVKWLKSIRSAPREWTA